MDLIRRLFVPEIQELKAKLHAAETERDWYRERCGEFGPLLNKAKADLKAEIVRNRKREDLLYNQLLEISGGRTLPVRIEEPQAEPEPDGQISSMALELLAERAREYCKDRYPDEPDQHFERVFEQMKTDPEHWLTD